jgi:hypothetical protein
MIVELLHVCHLCKDRKKNCNGPCACTVDGRDIIDHAKAGDCPKDYFRNAPKTADPREALAIGSNFPCRGCGQ